MLNKKYTLTILGIFLLIGIVFAGDLISIIKEDKIVDKDTKILLESSAIRQGYSKFPSYKVSELSCSSERCNPVRIDIKGIGHLVCDIKPYKIIKTFDKEIVESIRVNYTPEEMKQQIKECETKWLKNIASREKINKHKDNEVYKVIQQPKEINIKEVSNVK